MNFLELIDEELEQLDEASKRIQISADRTKKRVATRSVQKRRANRTRNMTKAARSRASKKAGKTRSRDSQGMKQANRKRKKAMKIRKTRGL